MKYNILFFGTDEFSIKVLEELMRHDIVPATIITAPNRPQGRGLTMTPPPVKVWADEHNIPTLQPEAFSDDFMTQLGIDWDLFLLASYGGIIPQKLLNIPKHGTLNVHPSLLPLYRGASPIESAILNDDKETGVTIMLMDNKVDHGPIIMQEVAYFSEWPQKPVVRDTLATLGGRLLSEAIPLWLTDSIDAQEQDHTHATYTKKITKSDGELSLNDSTYENFLKIQAYTPWPGTFFFTEKKGKQLRVKITDATYEDGVLKILRVIPEGKKEMSYESFLQQ